jgi:heptaprenyl diphosphate synthase
MFLCFFAAAWLSGKKVSPLATILVSAGIVLANLLVPVGRVAARLGPLRITETALLEGLGKALVFEGLIYISKASIVPGLRLPGRFGALVAKAFVYYDRIVEYKGGIRPATLIEDADRLMLKVWEDPLAGVATKDRPAARPAATATLCAAILASYALLLVGR